MSASGIGVERTDFISVPVRDMERSKRFYAETLGLPSPNLDEDGWPEFETGNVSLYLVDPTNMGRKFEGPHSGYIALRVPNVAEARAEFEAEGHRVRGRGPRHGRLPHGLLPRPGRQCTHAPPKVRAR